MRSRGTITQRGSSFRVKVELPAGEDGTRHRLQVTCRTAPAAKKELTQLLRELDTGVAVASDRITVAQHLHGWLWEAPHGLAPKTVERYRQLAEPTDISVPGRVELQKLQAAQISRSGMVS